MSVPATLPNASTPAHEGTHSRARTYTAGFSDAFGDRQLVFDSAAGASLEILRLNPEFAGSPAFEAALRDRVEVARHVQHTSLATIHAVERGDDGSLSLISKHVSGRRVSELLPKAHGPSFALELIRLVTPALAALHRAGEGVAHGALSAERIVVTRDGRLVVIEHVLGSAIEALALPPQRLNELGLVVPAAKGPIRFDARSDMMQLGFVALSLLLGRRLDPADCPGKIPALLDEFAQASGSPILAGKIRGWLERAMQISVRSFGSAREAQDAFNDLPDDVDVRVAESTRALLEFPLEGGRHSGSPIKPHREVAAVKEVRTPASGRTFEEPAAILTSHAGASRGGGIGKWIIGALALVAAGEGVVLYVRPYTQAQAPVIEVRAPGTQPAGLAGPVALPPDTTTASQPVSTVVTTDQPALAKNDGAPLAGAGAVAPVAAGPRFGGLTVSSSMDLQVFTGGKLVGSTAGPIALNEGAHSMEFVNEALGFRLQQAVNVKNGQMTSVKITAPNGRISINAVPWADVTIDGAPAGETPLANLALPIGRHEIVFKHPQLGERTQTVVVKVDGLVRVTQTFQQDK